MCKSFRDERYALMYTGSSHLNCIQVIFVRLSSVASPGGDRPTKVIPAPTLFYVVKEKKTVTVHSWSLHLGFGARDPFYPGQVFSI